MSDYFGQPGTIDQVPFPGVAVALVSSTNAAPTVITATAHGLHTGQAAIIVGHLVNTAVNGIWLVTVLTANTFKISTFAGFPATSVAGVGVGGATGTVQSLALPGITLPEDLTIDRDAASVNVPFEALADMCAVLAYRALAKSEILDGGTWTLKTGSAGTVAVGAELLVKAGALILDTDGLFKPSIQVLDGTIAFRPPQRFGDADNTINVSSGHEVILSTAPTTARVLTLVAPIRDGLWLDFNLHDTGATPASDYYEIKRSGSVNYICRLTGWTTDEAVDLGTGRVRIIADGGVWRLAGGVGIEKGADA